MRFLSSVALAKAPKFRLAASCSAADAIASPLIGMAGALDQPSTPARTTRVIPRIPGSSLSPTMPLQAVAPPPVSPQRLHDNRATGLLHRGDSGRGRPDTSMMTLDFNSPRPSKRTPS